MVKKVCINCEFADMAFADKEYESIADMVADSQNDYLVCTRSIKKVDDYDTCRLWKKCKDAKMMFLKD